MALGLKYGFTRPEGKDAAYTIAREFTSRFKEAKGSLLCRELIGYDISLPQDFQVAKDRDLFKKICPQLVRKAAEIVSELYANPVCHPVCHPV